MTKKKQIIDDLVEEYNHNVLLGSIWSGFTVLFGCLAILFYYNSGLVFIFGGLISFAVVIMRTIESYRINKEIKEVDK